MGKTKRFPKIYEMFFDEDEAKCGSCNNYALRHYSLEQMPSKNDQTVPEYSDGLCAQCFVDILVDLG